MKDLYDVVIIGSGLGGLVCANILAKENLRVCILEKNQQFKEVVDWYNTPTYVPDFVNATKELIQKDLEGIFHLVGSDFISRYDWSQKVADIFHLKKNLIKPIDSSELKLPVERNNIKLNNNKLLQNTGYKMAGVEEGLRKMLENK